METNKKSLKLTVSDIAIISIMVATLEGGKMALSFLPNVEIVTLLIILYTKAANRSIPFGNERFVYFVGLNATAHSFI